jgi:multisubunit Na+/H+ antiporter MnhB subunit
MSGKANDVNVMTTYWFKQRRFGMGATPNTWQGWLFMLVFLAIVLGCVALVMLAGRHNSPEGAFGALALLVVAVLVMVFVSWRKTEGGWRWHWGNE